MRQTTLREIDEQMKTNADIEVNQLSLDRSGVQPVLIAKDRVTPGSPSDLAGLIAVMWPGSWIGGYDTVEPDEYDLNRPYEASIWMMIDGLHEDVAVVRGTAKDIIEIRLLLEKSSREL